MSAGTDMREAAVSAGADPEPRKCDAVLAYCGLPMHHAEPHEFARAELRRAQGGPSVIDVDALARAMHAVLDHPLPGACVYCRRRAAKIAAEYARLSRPSDEREGEPSDG